MSLALAKVFYYQNPHTKQPSSAPVSAKQLCRILCPVNSQSANGQSKANSFLNENTMVIEFDPVQNKYDEKGWTPINQVPILKEACSTWYFEFIEEESKDDNGSSDQSTKQSTKGPLSCREIATKYYQQLEDNIEGNHIVNSETRVWSTALSDGAWKPIRELPDLLDAMEAFQDTIHVNMDPSNVSNKDPIENNKEDNKDNENADKREENSLLDDFFSSTAELGEDLEGNDGDEEEYQSDGGTNYVKKNEEWMKATKKKQDFDSLTKKRNESKKVSYKVDSKQQKESVSKKKKFKAKNAKCWVYATNLPSDTNEQEVANYFKKVGVLDIDPECQHPKVKLYRYKGGEEISLSNGDAKDDEKTSTRIAKKGELKGDASVCYARAESVNLAIQLLDDSTFRTQDNSGKFLSDPPRISVQRAKFEAHGEYQENKKRKVSDVKRKVARLAKLQAIGWDDGDNGRITGGLKGLRLIVLKNLFDASALREVVEAKVDCFLLGVEKEIREKCGEFGTVEKITIFYKNRKDGVGIVKFTQPSAAEEAIQEFQGKSIRGTIIESSYWDGVTDYTVRNFDEEEKDTEKRLDEFGNWLDNQELPEEFQLNVEKH